MQGTWFTKGQAGQLPGHKLRLSYFTYSCRAISLVFLKVSDIHKGIWHIYIMIKEGCLSPTYHILYSNVLAVFWLLIIEFNLLGVLLQLKIMTPPCTYIYTPSLPNIFLIHKIYLLIYSDHVQVEKRLRTKQTIMFL